MEFSPLQLIQEELRDDPWKLLVACILLNQTCYKAVRPLLPRLFVSYPDAYAMSQARVDDLVPMLKPLGFYNKRAHILIRFSSEFLSGTWHEPEELYGIGKYGSDSYNMFVRNNVIETDPTDRKLMAYKDWFKRVYDSHN